MTRPFVKVFTVAATLVALALASPAQAQSAEAYLKAKQSQLTSIVESDGAETRLNQTFDALLDYDALASESLRDHWSELSADQRKEFKSLLKTLVQRAYTKSIRDTLDYDIKWKGEKAADTGRLVSTVARHKTDKRKEPVSIDYLIHKVGGSWRVYDIITEGSGLVSNYRSQFNRVIDKKGVEGLLSKMREKANKG